MRSVFILTLAGANPKRYFAVYKKLVPYKKRQEGLVLPFLVFLSFFYFYGGASHLDILPQFKA
jgi:hypothetical protein